MVRWKVLPADEREGIKNYVVGKIMDIAKDEATMEREKLFLNKLNIVLVQILKQVGGVDLLHQHRTALHPLTPARTFQLTSPAHVMNPVPSFRSGRRTGRPSSRTS